MRVTTVYSRPGCVDCEMLDGVLARHEMTPDQRFNVRADEAARAAAIALIAPRELLLPVVVFEDGDVLIEPSEAELEAKLAA